MHPFGSGGFYGTRPLLGHFYFATCLLSSHASIAQSLGGLKRPPKYGGGLFKQFWYSITSIGSYFNSGSVSVAEHPFRETRLNKIIYINLFIVKA